MILDLGCGPAKYPGSIGIDSYPFEGVDIVRDLRRGLPFHSDSVEAIIAKHILEHFDGTDLIFIIEEMYRVSKSQSRWRIEVPDAYSPNRYRDPTHKTRDWSEDSFMLWEVNEKNDWLIFVGPEYQRKAKLKVWQSKVTDDKTRNRVYDIEVIK